MQPLTQETAVALWWNTRGELIGINTAIVSQTGSLRRLRICRTYKHSAKVVTDLRQFGVVQRAVLGISMGDITDQLAKEKNLKTMEGAFVGEVIENSAAEKAGIKKEDIIIQINGVDVKSAAQLQEQVGRYSPGDKITATVLRDNKKITLNAELKNRQGNTGVVSSNTNIDILGASFKEPDSKPKISSS